MTDLYRRLLDKGCRGGIKCECCNISKGRNKEKQRVVRKIKHRVKSIIKRMDKNEDY